LSPYFSSCFMVSRPFTTFPKITWELSNH
jgi:hypothetical protein